MFIQAARACTKRSLRDL